ncbi:15496_t:CDS:1, partial [Gigaspora rosea]
NWPGPTLKYPSRQQKETAYTSLRPQTPADKRPRKEAKARLSEN